MNKRIKKKHAQKPKLLLEDAIVISESTSQSLLSSNQNEPIKSRTIINADDMAFPNIITGFEFGDSPHDRICKMLIGAEAYWWRKMTKEK